MEFTSVLFGSPASRELLVVIAAYLDESGTHQGSKAVVVGGFVSHVARWRRFTKDWRRLLAAEGLTHFHATDLETFNGEFNGWHPAKKIRFQQSLIGIIRSRVAGGVACGFDIRDYDALIPVGSELRQLVGSPYTFSACQCMTRVLDWAQVSGIKEQLAFVFEAGDVNQGELTERMKAMKETYPQIGSVTFGDKVRLLPLQAADFHAYEAWKHAENRVVDGPTRNVRKSLEALLFPGIQGWILNREKLAGFAAEASAWLAQQNPPPSSEPR